MCFIKESCAKAVAYEIILLLASSRCIVGCAKGENALPLNYWLRPEDDDDDFDYEDEHVEMESEKDEYEEDDLEEDLSAKDRARSPSVRERGSPPHA